MQTKVLYREPCSASALHSTATYIPSSEHVNGGKGVEAGLISAICTAYISVSGH